MADNVHASTAAPAGARSLDMTGEPEGNGAPVLARRNYRASSTGDVIAATTPHSDRGNADARRGHATILPDPGDEAAPTQYSNDLALVVVNPEAAPERPRQGFTGSDPARAATYRRPMFLRLFDKFAADHAGPIVKAEQPAPLASRPRSGLGDIAGGQPFAGGQTGTQSAGIGPGRNSFRVLPDAWDALLVDTGGPAVSATVPDPAYAAAAGQVARGRFR